MAPNGPISGSRAAGRRPGYDVLDIALHLAHQSLIVFTVLGWMFCETRPLHLGVMVLVGVSWLGFGMFRGFGYCLLTDMHWTLKERRGGERPAVSYMKFLADQLSGRDLDAALIDAVTYVTCALCTAASHLLILAAGTC